MGEVLCIMGPMDGQRVDKSSFSGVVYETDFGNSAKLETKYELFRLAGGKRAHDIMAPIGTDPDLLLDTLIGGYRA